MDQSLPAIAIRLADEGVPLRAIARGTGIASTQLYETLVEAKLSGQLLSLPRDDWPPGTPRDERSLQLSRLASSDHDSLMFAVKQLFGLTPIASKLLLLLMQYEHVPHARVDIDHVSFVVHICLMRKALEIHGLSIRTLWGYGYQMPAADRKKAMALILDQVASPA